MEDVLRLFYLKTLLRISQCNIYLPKEKATIQHDIACQLFLIRVDINKLSILHFSQVESAVAARI